MAPRVARPPTVGLAGRNGDEIHGIGHIPEVPAAPRAAGAASHLRKKATKFTGSDRDGYRPRSGGSVARTGPDSPSVWEPETMISRSSLTNSLPSNQRRGSFRGSRSLRVSALASLVALFSASWGASALAQ